jgi:hypothetical protein
MILQSNIWLLRSCSPMVQGLKVCTWQEYVIPAAQIAMYVIPAATSCKVFFNFFPYVIHLKVNQKLFCSCCSPIVLGHRVCSMHLISEHVIPHITESQSMWYPQYKLQSFSCCFHMLFFPGWSWQYVMLSITNNSHNWTEPKNLGTTYASIYH